MQKANRKNGSAIAYGLVMIAVVSIILVSMVQFVVSQVKYGFYAVAKEEAFDIAEAGVQQYRWYLAHQTDGKTTQEVRDFWINGNPRCVGEGNECEVEFSDPVKGPIGKYRMLVTAPDPNSNTVTAISTGWTYKYPDSQRTIKVRFRRSSWSDFAVLNDESGRFDQYWDIKGKVMSNTGIQYDGVAHNVVYAGQSQYYDSDSDIKANKPGVWTSWANEYNNTLGSNVFLAGKKFAVSPKDFAGVTVDLGMMQIEAQKPNKTTLNNCTSTGCYFTTTGGIGRHIKFKTDGKFDISTVTSIKNKSNSIKTESAFSTLAIPNNGLIFVNGDVWVEGTINAKRVTVVAAILPNGGTNANIYVGSNNLAYTNKDGRDVIGLIAQGNIEISSDSPDNFELDAAMLAQNGAVTKIDYNPNCCGGGCEESKNKINIFGSVVSRKRMEFTIHKTCNNSKFVGYQSKKIEYDNNLLYFPPPFFPSDVYYGIDLWEEI